MTIPIDDPRVIDADAPQYNATLVRRVDQTDDLAYFWVKFDERPDPVRARAVHDDRGVRRRQALAAAVLGRVAAARWPAREGYEMYVRLVPIIRFTTLLWRLPIGHRMRMIGPKGKFLLEPDDRPDAPVHLDRHGHRPVHVDDPRDARRGPAAQDRRPPRLLLRRRARLSRRARGAGSATGPTRSPTFRPSAGRTIRATRAGRAGRAAPSTSSRDVCRDLRLRPEQTVVYICGNPDMILNAESRPHGPRLPRVPRQEGALLAQGQGRRRVARRLSAGGSRPKGDLRPARNVP